MVLQYTVLGMWWLCGFHGANGQNGQDLFGGGKKCRRGARKREGD